MSLETLALSKQGCVSDVSERLRDVAFPCSHHSDTQEAHLCESTPYPAADVGEVALICDRPAPPGEFREETAMTSTTEGMGTSSMVMPSTCQTHSAAPGSITGRIDEAPTVPRTQTPDLSLMDLSLSKVCGYDHEIEVALECTPRHSNSQLLNASRELETVAPSETLTLEVMSPFIQAPFGVLRPGGVEESKRLDTELQHADTQQNFTTSTEYADSIMGTPGQMMMTVMIKTPSSMSTELPPTSREASGEMCRLASPTVDQNEAPAISLITPTSMVTTVLSFSDALGAERESTCPSENAKSDTDQPEIQLPTPFLTQPRLGATMLNALKDAVPPSRQTSSSVPELERSDLGRPCLLGHCMCSAALSLCGRLHRFMSEPTASPTSSSMGQESSVPRMQVMFSACTDTDTPLEKCKENVNMSGQPASHTLCSEALSTETIFLSSPSPPGLPRSFANKHADDRKLLIERDLGLDGLSSCDVDPQDIRIHGSSVPVLQQQSSRCMVGQSSATATPDADLEKQTGMSTLAASVMFIEPEREGSLPMPPRRVLGELNSDVAQPGEEARNLMGLGSKLRFPDFVDGPTPMQNVSSPAPLMTSPQAARYMAERDSELIRSHSLGRKRSKKRKSSKENVGRNTNQEHILHTSALESKASGRVGDKPESKEELLLRRGLQEKFEAVSREQKAPPASTSQWAAPPSGLSGAIPVDEAKRSLSL